MQDLEKIRGKPAKFGPDINMDDYSLRSENHPEINSISELPQIYQTAASRVGIDLAEKRRSGSFFQLDHSVICSKSQPGVEVMDIEAIKRYGLEGYWWKAVPVDMDKYTAQAELCRTHGYFVRSMPGKKTVFPLQACLLIGKERLAQNVHNLIIAEENSELHLITGCSTSPKVSSVLHLGISEFFVERNAKITFTMIHFWPQKAEVRPRTGVVIKENGTFISNYICMSPARSLQMFPTAFCKGKNARAVFQTVVSASGNSVMDIGTKAVLEKGNCRAEILTKVIAEDGAEIIARGHLVGNSPETKAHLECRGLLLSPGASIQAIPQLEAKTSGAELSHEAAIGKISDDEIRYLMARGLTSDEATSLIVSGFLKVDTGGLPPPIRKEIDRVMGASM